MIFETQTLENAFERYLISIHNPRLPSSEKRIDLKHLCFWYPYYAQVVTAIAYNQKPMVEKRTIKEINTQSQIDNESLSNTQIEETLRVAQQKILQNLPKIGEDQYIPYKKGSRYLPERYQDILVTHLKMHWEYLDKLTRE